MKQDVVVHDIHLVDINGWRFDFKRMIASRITATSNGKNSTWIIWLEKDKMITAPADFLKTIEPPTTSNHGTWNWDKWWSFFVPPEDHYNRMINEAYMNYLLEKSLSS